MLKEKAEIMNNERVERSIKRMMHEILECNPCIQDVAIVGIKTRGVPLAKRLHHMFKKFEGIDLPLGYLDITLYRDDLTTIAQQPVVHGTHIPFDVTGKIIILVDDVLYTGRTVRAALDELIDFGRPAAIQLAVLVDRGHRELPIRADFVGKNIPTSHKEVIAVRLEEIDGQNKVVIMEEEE